MLSRLVIVSNRVASARDKSARAGGLAVALREALAQRGGLWFGWSGEVTDAPTAVPTVHRSRTLTSATIDLTPDDHEAFYASFANGMIWPLFHYRPGLFQYHRGALEGYLRVNALFARHLAPLLGPDDIVWVHDYHFIPLAAELRRLGARNQIGFFLHIPLPVPELLVALPGHKRLIADLCCYDLIGFQTDTFVRAFCRYIVEEARGTCDASGTVEAFGRKTRIAAFPIGIDTARFAQLAAEAMSRPETSRLKEDIGTRKLIIGVDRLDYSKGLSNRFDAYQDVLERWPEHRAQVVFLQIAPISRGEVAQYRTLRRELDGRAGRINGKYARYDWTPLRYLNTSFNRDVLAGFFRIARVGFVTPTRDGMNLVAKEYVAAQDPSDPGALVLSRFAGAAEELSEALLVNPYDVDELANALHSAINMPRDERLARWTPMMERVARNTVTVWRDRFLKALE